MNYCGRQSDIYIRPLTEQNTGTQDTTHKAKEEYGQTGQEGNRRNTLTT
jgi:hypothetical protein